jgi:hypothetical protein
VFGLTLENPRNICMRKPAIDEELCIGRGHCTEVSPRVFELIDDK